MQPVLNTVRPIRQTHRQLTVPDDRSRLSILLDRFATYVACLCGPMRPTDPLVVLNEQIDSVPLYD